LIEVEDHGFDMIFNAKPKRAEIPLYMLKSTRGFFQIPKIAFIRKS